MLFFVDFFFPGNEADKPLIVWIAEQNLKFSVSQVDGIFLLPINFSNPWHLLYVCIIWCSLWFNHRAPRHVQLTSRAVLLT